MEAIYDIADLTKYVEDNFDIITADKFQNRLKNELYKLSYVAGIYGKTNICYQNYQIYKKPFSPSIIFYIIKELEREIHVIRILREEKNWMAVLRNITEYKYPT